jgi:phospholipid/cholesterol/gamma-HCH transport system substrate-binding protein
MAMNDQPDTPVQNSEPAATKPVKHLELKATVLLIFTALLVAGSAVYLLYARGFFEPTQTLVLVTDDSEGVVVGMDMTFSGFPIGRVRRVELAETGNVHIVVDVAKKDAHWLRTSSIFTLVRGLVGGTNIRAFTGILTDPPLPDGAQRPVLRGDATAELPRVLAAAKETLENLSAITAQDAALRTSLANLRDVTEKLKGPRGALGAVFGNEADAQKLVAALDRANALLARLDGMVGKADTQVFGPEGVVKEARATVVQLNGLLAETRTSLKKVDAVLVEAQGISANVRGATTDLGALRADVDANLRKIEGMINELNRKWPFARDTEVKLP